MNIAKKSSLQVAYQVLPTYLIKIRIKKRNKKDKRVYQEGL